MTQIVVDTTVIIAVLINEPSKLEILELTREAELLAPISLDIEIGNAFSRMLKRGRIQVESAIAVVRLFDQIPIQRIDVDLDSAIRLAHHLDIYAYDAYVIDCARAAGAPLLSLDRGLLEACRRARLQFLEVSS